MNWWKELLWKIFKNKTWEHKSEKLEKTDKVIYPEKEKECKK